MAPLARLWHPCKRYDLVLEEMPKANSSTWIRQQLRASMVSRPPNDGGTDNDLSSQILSWPLFQNETVRQLRLQAMTFPTGFG